MASSTTRLIERRKGFTLLEVLVSTIMCAILLLAVSSLLHGAFSLRENAEKTLQVKHPVQYALTALQRDLENIAAPSDYLGGALYGEEGGKSQFRQDSIEMHTTTGIILEEYPWGDIQKVSYALERGRDLDDYEEMYLVRRISRNLLSDSDANEEKNAEYEILLKGVYHFEITYYDGQSWYDSWDSTEQEESPLPAAVRVRLYYSPNLHQDEEDLKAEKNPLVYPYELLIPILVEPKEEEEEQSETSTDLSASGGYPS
ncbi:MAG: prepilin-type N-terminal cleavage/methylation domain-containing protein [Candidatus Omnitrophica bacterium]|nr:prepilin-type N-terminal cleavage/methylation domain-containing protein [Candidatus Omnitrophota bacterium]